VYPLNSVADVSFHTKHKQLLMLQCVLSSVLPGSATEIMYIDVFMHVDFLLFANQQLGATCALTCMGLFLKLLETPLGMLLSFLLSLGTRYVI